MPDDYKKDLIGVEDMFIDDRGISQKRSRKTSTGGTHQISAMNAQLIPILLLTRTLEMYDEQVLTAEEVDGALTSICASLASIKKFENEDELDKIQSGGSGTVISILERQKLNEITDTGSGNIISVAERNKLNSLVGLSQEQIDAILNIETIAPVGSVTMWTTGIPPANWLECDGSPISRQTYSVLFAVIGEMYGAGDGTTTFNLPDLRGRFPRGWDHGAANDPDAANRTDRGDGIVGDSVGTLQDDQIKSHTHQLRVYDGTDRNHANAGTSQVTGPTYHTTTLSTGGAETRPVNINLMFVIRFGV